MTTRQTSSPNPPNPAKLSKVQVKPSTLDSKLLDKVLDHGSPGWQSEELFLPWTDVQSQVPSASRPCGLRQESQSPRSTDGTCPRRESQRSQLTSVPSSANARRNVLCIVISVYGDREYVGGHLQKQSNIFTHENQCFPSINALMTCSNRTTRVLSLQLMESSHSTAIRPPGTRPQSTQRLISIICIYGEFYLSACLLCCATPRRLNFISSPLISSRSA